MRRIIDGDGHIFEPPDLWLNYAHSSYHDQVPTSPLLKLKMLVQKSSIALFTTLPVLSCGLGYM